MQDQQEIRKIRFVSKILGGEYGYPPGGWTEIHGDTGKSAFLWSLIKWRTEINARPTLILPIVERYDYKATAVNWAGIDERLLVAMHQQENILALALGMVKLGMFGQVVAEGLGFMLGRGEIRPDMFEHRLLGPISAMRELAHEAEERDVALYATSYSVGIGREYLSEYSLGGKVMLDVAANRRVFLTQSGFHLAGGRHAGEYFLAENLLDTTHRRGRFEIVYKKGPVRLRTPEKEDEFAQTDADASEEGEPEEAEDPWNPLG